MSFLVFSCTPEAGKKKAGRAAKSSVKEAAAKKEPETGEERQRGERGAEEAVYSRKNLKNFLLQKRNLKR